MRSGDEEREVLYCKVYPGGTPLYLDKTYSDGRLQAESIDEMKSRLGLLVQRDRVYIGAEWEDFALPFSIVDEEGREVASLSKRDIGYISYADWKRDHSNSSDGTT